MKIVMPGGSGHVGRAIRRHLEPLGWEFVILSRRTDVRWDGRTVDRWAAELERATAVINLAGRSVNCRYTEANLREMMDSRVDSTRAIGLAISQSMSPPKVWLQASTATIYAHRFDVANDEETGILGGDEPGAPLKWNASIAIAKAWEHELECADTPRTRKVAMRSAMTMSMDKGSIFDVMAKMACRGFGGQAGDGSQFISWIHELDFTRAVQFLLERENLSGPINICSPNPLPNREFMRILRQAVRARFSLPAPKLALEIGALLMGTETELILKSRRVVPMRLMHAGFEFQFPQWIEAARDLALKAGFTD